MEWLVSWVWQGSVLALLLAGILRACPSVSAATRYWLWWIALVAVLVLPWAPVIAGTAGEMVPGSITAAPASPRGLLPIVLPAAPPGLLIALLAVWGGVTLVGIARVVGDARILRRLKRTLAPMPAAREQRLPLWLSMGGRGRRVRLCVSDEGLVASVLGLVAPVIVVPRTLLEVLTDDELDKIVLHEYAHVQRRDDWANLVQVLVTAVFGLHPAMWLIGKALRREREIASDDWVVSRCRMPRDYAVCLAKVATLAAWQPAPRLAARASGSRGDISRRVEQILNVRRNRGLRSSRPILAIAAAVVVTIVAQLGSLAPLIAFGNMDSGVRPATPRASWLPGQPTAALDVALSRRPPVRPVRATPLTGVVDDRPMAVDTRQRRDDPLQASPLPRGFSALRLGPHVPATGVAPSLAAAPPTLPSRRLTAGGLAVAIAHTSSGHLASRAALLQRATAGEVPLDDRGTWGRVADAGTSVGGWFADAGQATAGAFTGLGASFKRAFTDGR